MFPKSFEGMTKFLNVSEHDISFKALYHNRQKSEPSFSTQPR